MPDDRRPPRRRWHHAGVNAPEIDPDDPPVVRVPVERIRDGVAAAPAGHDDVAIEAPLEVRFAGRAATVLMRTPGHDDELVRGFLLSEGIIESAEDIVRIVRPPDLPTGEAGNVVDVELFPSPSRKDLDRPLFSSSSCGVCGKRSIASLEIPAKPSVSPLRVPRQLLGSLPARMRTAQTTFDRTGGVHACGLFTADGSLLALREDVGRHNAVDKVVGWALAQGRLPLADSVLVVSGRISYELAQKAIVAGVPILVAVGAPSSLALEIGGRYGLTLVGFVRSESMNVYTHPERVVV
jgi:FdhD protein